MSKLDELCDRLDSLASEERKANGVVPAGMIKVFAELVLEAKRIQEEGPDPIVTERVIEVPRNLSHEDLSGIKCLGCQNTVEQHFCDQQESKCFKLLGACLHEPDWDSTRVLSDSGGVIEVSCRNCATAVSHSHPGQPLEWFGIE